MCYSAVPYLWHSTLIKLKGYEKVVYYTFMDNWWLSFNVPDLAIGVAELFWGIR